MSNKIKSMGGFQLSVLLLDKKLDYSYFIEDNNGNRFAVTDNGFECVYYYEDEVEDEVVLEDKYYVFTLDDKGFPTYYGYHDFYEDGEEILKECK